MRPLLLSLFVLFPFFITLASAQTIVNTRTALLDRGGRYTATGSAILEEFDDGTLQLRLSEDYSTQFGPDVQIFLSDDPLSTSNSVQIADIGATSGGGINHFSGAITFDVPAGVGINDFDHVVFYCVAFRQYWVSGDFDAAAGGNDNTEDPVTESECQQTIAATTNWGTEVTICENDGVADVIPLLNTVMIPAGDTYAYIITDGNNNIEQVVFEDSYDFEGSGLEVNRVYGVSYDGTLNYNTGDALTSITADGCAILSNTDIFLTVTKEDCTPAFECQETIAATTNWGTEVTICENDGVADVIPLLNTLMIPAGDNYAYIITDGNNNIEQVVLEGSYDFEGSGLGINRVYGISHDGPLMYSVGAPLTSITAEGCSILSSAETFLTVTKEDCTPAFECQETSVGTTNLVTAMTICENDGVADVIPLVNNLSIPAGANYSYIITDENNNIEEVLVEASYNFEGSGFGVNRVYGISHDGTLNYSVGASLTSITASEGCSILSSTTSFLTVTKVDCTPAFECQETTVGTTNLVTAMTICENDGVADMIPLVNNLSIPAGANYSYIITDENNNIEEVLAEASYNFEGSGFGVNRVYGISHDGTLIFSVGASLTSIRASEGCSILSSTTSFLTITKVDCTPAFECQETSVTAANSTTEVMVCSNDGIADLVSLTNDLMIPVGDNYSYIITDENNNIEQVLLENSFDFEGTGSGINRVYGISHDGTLVYSIGDALTSITTTEGCSILSSTATFLTVTKENCTASITGTVVDQEGNGLEAFEVVLNNGITTRTNSAGQYEFLNIPTNTTYEIRPRENSDVSNGVTSFDLVLIKRHILGVDIFNSPYQMIAADASNDGRVTTFDIIELQRLILGLSDDFSNNESWRFLNAEEAVIDPFAFSESITIENLTNDATGVNFLGVKIGDVSVATPGGLIESSSRSKKILQFSTKDAFVKRGHSIKVPITAENFDQIIGYQFTMKLAGIAFIDVEAGALAINKNNFAQLDEQTVTTVWSSDKAVSLNQTLFTVVVEALEDVSLSDALTFDASVTPALAYEASTNSMGIALNFESLTRENGAVTQLLQNTPNPFQDETTIGFELAEQGTVVLQVFDASGRNIITKTNEYQQGKHSIQITNSDNLPEGLLYYQLSTADFKATRKMIRGRK